MSTPTESVELVVSVEPEIARLMDEHRDRRQHWWRRPLRPGENPPSMRAWDPLTGRHVQRQATILADDTPSL